MHLNPTSDSLENSSGAKVHPACLSDDDLLNECQMRTQRGSGPGGQHRNKTDTAVCFTHLPTGILGEATEARQQLENRDNALKRLRIELALFVREEPGVATSSLWKTRCDGGKLKINPVHRDFGAILSEALDVVCAYPDDWKRACERLAISSSQLIKLLKLEPRAFQMVNQMRRNHNQRPFH